MKVTLHILMFLMSFSLAFTIPAYAGDHKKEKKRKVLKIKRQERRQQQLKEHKAALPGIQNRNKRSRAQSNSVDGVAQDTNHGKIISGGQNAIPSNTLNNTNVQSPVVNNQQLGEDNISSPVGCSTQEGQDAQVNTVDGETLDTTHEIIGGHQQINPSTYGVSGSGQAEDVPMED